ncbi:hypothetical protein Bca101_025850 [Brassica carinata]
MRLPNRLLPWIYLGWATTLIGFPLIFIIKLIYAVPKSNSPKRKKIYSYKQEPSIVYLRAKRHRPHH